MLVEHEGRRPRVADSAYVAPTAVLCGDVTVGDEARILFGAVLAAEGGEIQVGGRCIVMENAVLRGREGHPVTLGDHVLVGPHAHVNGATIDDDVFLATGVSVFPGARVGKGCEVRINGVVHVNSALREGVTVPIGWIAVGDPAELFPPEAHEELWPIQRRMDFPRTVFGIERAEMTMEKVARRYAERFGRHRDDRVLE
ncbi:MAG: gamma carbonic anhydrase family protein [Thermoleophilaceae bacterium]|nr:gamma carbonic anhydrase family protein [Thermoleophilaceae bacterium]